MRIPVTVYFIGSADGASAAHWLPARHIADFGIGMLGASGIVVGWMVVLRSPGADRSSFFRKAGGAPIIDT
jgi:hypothetical protein